METSATARSTIAKREKLLALYRMKPEYEKFVIRRQANGLPATPRTDSAKREWEKKFYQWRTCIMSDDKGLVEEL